jgi:hypothetical protein
MQNIHKNNQWENTCGAFRVRFYPSSGGEFVNGWRNMCGSGIVATDVLNGTRFRIESSLSDLDYYWFDVVD